MTRILMVMLIAAVALWSYNIGTLYHVVEPVQATPVTAPSELKVSTKPNGENYNPQKTVDGKTLQ